MTAKEALKEVSKRLADFPYQEEIQTINQALTELEELKKSDASKEQSSINYFNEFKRVELETLRKKETPMKPTSILTDFYEPSIGICKCGKQVDSSQRYCDSCGPALDWSDRDE